MAKDVPYPPVYGFWTHQLGGCVSKTALSFHMATTYAELFPNKAVVVIDMCPQTSLSATLLTTTTKKPSEKRPGGEVVQYMQDFQRAQGQIPKTVGGYLMARLTNHTVPAKDFLMNVLQDGYNPHVPSNLGLVCGDSNLDLLMFRLNARARESPNTRLNCVPFRDVHYYLRDFIQELAEYYVNCGGPLAGKELVVFIDTNPTLNIYTEIALCAMTELVVPIHADAFSSSAVNSAYHQLYGLYPTTSTAAHAFEQDTFASRVRENNMSLPAITAIIYSRNPIHKSGRYKAVVAKAQKAIAAEQCDKLYQGYLKADESGQTELERVFATKKYADDSPVECNNIKDFANSYVATMTDMTGTGVAALHSGLPLWILLQRLKCIDNQFKGIDFKESVPSLMKDLLNAMELMLGATHWAEKDAKAMKRLKRIAKPLSIWKWLIRVCCAVLCCAVLYNLCSVPASKAHSSMQ